MYDFGNSKYYDHFNATQSLYLSVAGMARTGSTGNDLKDEGMDIDIDFYITSVSALLKLIQAS